MKFIIEKEVFTTLPNLYIGLVVIKDVKNNEFNNVKEYLNECIKNTENNLEGLNVKELDDIICYRDAFIKMGINPNKYMCSIEALLSRIAKKKGFPSINTLVDLGNAVSIKYHLPIGAHDINSLDNSLEVRYAKDGDTFIPFGETETEKADEKELVYVSGNTIRTRRYIWRQSELGKITEDTTSVVYPIDGFSDINKDKIIEAQNELKTMLEQTFNVEVTMSYVDINQNEVTL